MMGSLSARKISGKTGRSAQVLLNDERTYHQVVQRFVETLGTCWPRSWYWSSLLVSYPVAWRTWFEIGKARSIGLHGTYFRSRRFTSCVPAPSVTDLGPPPRGKQSEGRYTDGRDVVLYLSRSPRVAILESRANAGKPGYSSNASNFPFLTFKYLRLSQDLEATAPVLQVLAHRKRVSPGGIIIRASI